MADSQIGFTFEEAEDEIVVVEDAAPPPPGDALPELEPAGWAAGPDGVAFPVFRVPLGRLDAAGHPVPAGALVSVAWGSDATGAWGRRVHCRDCQPFLTPEERAAGERFTARKGSRDNG